MGDISNDTARPGAPAAHEIPADPHIRRRIAEVAAQASLPQTLDRETLETAGRDMLAALNLPESALGFLLIELNNAYWREAFAALPCGKRLLLLPHCLRDSAACKGGYAGESFACAGCGACDLSGIRKEAVALGYRVRIEEGAPSILKAVLAEEAEGVLGVACMDSLEKAYPRVSALGLPHLAVPLLKDGCRDTETDLARLRELLRLSTDAIPTAHASLLPLLRHTRALFAPKRLIPLLAGALEVEDGDPPGPARFAETTAFAWLRRGGKRLRPFAVLACHLVGRDGGTALATGTPPTLPDEICRLAVAIEALHKASLVHDDIEDDDATRYGRPTLHRAHGVAQAINVGDALVGLGYRLVAEARGALGAAAAGDIVALLADAHLRLCRWQGAELAWQRGGVRQMRPLDVLAIYAGKTAPAFHAALYTGLRAAEADFDEQVLKAYARAVGVAYQIQDDLEDWDRGADGHIRDGRDAIAGRPTLPHLLALENANGEQAARLHEPYCDCMSAAEFLEERAYLYESTGAFEQARELMDRYRRRALGLAGELGEADLAELLRRLARLILGDAR